MKYPPWRPGGWLEGACLKLRLLTRWLNS